MERIFVFSDAHFGHDREFLWGPRGFKSSIEHDEATIANWNSVVGPDDIVYHLMVRVAWNALMELLGSFEETTTQTADGMKFIPLFQM